MKLIKRLICLLLGHKKNEILFNGNFGGVDIFGLPYESPQSFIQKERSRHFTEAVDRLNFVTLVWYNQTIKEVKLEYNRCLRCGRKI